MLSQVGSFVDFWGGFACPTQIRKTPRKPIRVFLQTGTQDLATAQGDWSLANLEMAAAFQFAGYDYRLALGDGGHDLHHSGAILPDALTWLWR